MERWILFSEKTQPLVCLYMCVCVFNSFSVTRFPARKIANILFKHQLQESAQSAVPVGLQSPADRRHSVSITTEKDDPFQRKETAARRKAAASDSCAPSAREEAKLS